MIPGLAVALFGTALMAGPPLVRALARPQADRDTLRGIGAALAADSAVDGPLPGEWTTLLGRLSDAEPPAPREIVPYDI